MFSPANQTIKDQSDEQQRRLPAAKYDLDRFVKAQDHCYAEVVNELRAGEKESCWMWFIFPQIAGLGESPRAQFFAISGIDEAKAYLSHPVLGARLIECCELLMAIEGKSAEEILGFPDDLKLRSCVTLFQGAEPDHSIFGQILIKFYKGERDPLTLDIIGSTESAV